MSGASKCLTLIGTATIQDYLFRSNRLKENLGASWLVADALERWNRDPWKQFYEEKVFIGGGNAALIFSDSGAAREAVWKWSLDLQTTAPGLRVLAVHVPIENGLKHAFKRAQQDLFLRENRAPCGWELGALPVVRVCASTGLSAVELKDEQWLSQESISKRTAAAGAKEKIQERYSAALEDGKLEFPDELDNLGTQEGASQIAVVHADGDGVGQILQTILDESESDAELKSRYKDASTAISALAQDAFRETLLDLTEALPSLKEKGILPSGNSYPLRPIVDGGDDLTFVCHGRLGLALAARYLKHFEEQSEKHEKALGKRLTACAGVMVVPGKFPFARAYHLAEQLSVNAKRVRKERNRKEETEGGSWMDFQVCLEGTQPTIDQTRQQAYWQESSRGSDMSGTKLCLIRRPYCISRHDDLGWSSFEEKWRRFRDWPRSRAKRLLETLARGEEATAQLLEEWRSRGREFNVERPWRDEATRVKLTPYFDALEMLDFHVDSSVLERSVT